MGATRNMRNVSSGRFLTTSPPATRSGVHSSSVFIVQSNVANEHNESIIFLHNALSIRH